VTEYQVTWQMTGSIALQAADDLEAKTMLDAMNDRDVLMLSQIQGTQVIATREM
jgi:hypothetical protein